jgi:DNA processing protein
MEKSPNFTLKKMGAAEEKIYAIALGLMPGIGSVNARQLISYCGGAKAVFDKKPKQLERVPGIGAYVINVLKSNAITAYLKDAEAEYKFCQQHQIDIICYYDTHFPKRLHHCKDAPYLIYQKGNLDLNAAKVVSIVGTRNATNYGQMVTDSIVEALAPYEVIIVSGLAYGIDAIAHKKALEVKLPTVGVLAHGLDQVYPYAHRQLAEKIITENGALISEFRIQTKPDKQNFPSRNRIVAGMSDATIVIESPAKGGSLITADIAQSYNRDVFAVPGRINDKFSEGCNNLIKQNVAALIHSGEDVVHLLGWNLNTKPSLEKPKQRSLFIDLDDNEQRIVSYLQVVNEPQHLDAINYKVDLPTSSISMALLSLELKGVVHSRPGSCYEML